MVANPLQTFGKRSSPPCGDCDSDGECTMNCGPAKKPEPIYSYTGTEDGDFVIWKGGTFVANVGGENFSEVGKQQIAFDVDKEHAELIVNALNASTPAPVDHAALDYRERAMQIAEAYGGGNPQDKLLLADAIAKAFLGYERSISALRAAGIGAEVVQMTHKQLCDLAGTWGYSNEEAWDTACQAFEAVGLTLAAAPSHEMDAT